MGYNLKIYIAYGAFALPTDFSTITLVILAKIGPNGRVGGWVNITKVRYPWSRQVVRYLCRSPLQERNTCDSKDPGDAGRLLG